MLRFIGALLGFALLAFALGFVFELPWSGLARSLFFLYAGVLGMCLAIALFTGRQPAGGSGSQKRSR